MKRFLTGFLIFLLLAAGIGYLLYPALSNQLCQRQSAGVMATYREKAAAMDAAQKAEMFAQAEAYNAGLENVRPGDVFAAESARTTRDYQNRMNIHSGVLAELVIPRIGISLPVYHQSTETPATQKLVHVEGSSLPADSGRESIVLAGPGILKAEGILGDIGLTDDRMLEDLDNLVPGDLMILNAADRTFVYRVGGIQTISPSGLQDLDLTPGEEEQKLTVICRREDRRLLVESERISIREARTLLEEDDTVSFAENWQNVLFLGSPVILAGLLVLWIIERIKRRAYRIPGEGRTSSRKEKKNREELEKITTTETDEGEKT